MKNFKELVFQNLGECSRAWSELPKGIFNAVLAEKLGNEIVNLHYKRIQYFIDRIEDLNISHSAEIEQRLLIFKEMINE